MLSTPPPVLTAPPEAASSFSLCWFQGTVRRKRHPEDHTTSQHAQHTLRHPPPRAQPGPASSGETMQAQNLRNCSAPATTRVGTAQSAHPIVLLSLKHLLFFSHEILTHFPQLAGCGVESRGQASTDLPSPQGVQNLLGKATHTNDYNATPQPPAPPPRDTPAGILWLAEAALW